MKLIDLHHSVRSVFLNQKQDYEMWACWYITRKNYFIVYCNVPKGQSSLFCFCFSDLAKELIPVVQNYLIWKVVYRVKLCATTKCCLWQLGSAISQKMAWQRKTSDVCCKAGYNCCGNAAVFLLPPFHTLLPTSDIGSFNGFIANVELLTDGHYNASYYWLLPLWKELETLLMHDQ